MGKIVLRQTKTWFLVLRFFWHPSKVGFFGGFQVKRSQKHSKKGGIGIGIAPLLLRSKISQLHIDAGI